MGKITERNNKLVKRFEFIESRLSKKATTEDGLVEIENDLEQFTTKDLPVLLNEYKDIREWMELAWELDSPLGVGDYKALYEVGHFGDS